MRRIHNKIQTSRRFCSVFGCSNYGTPQISLHVFPMNAKLRKIWADVLQISKPITKHMCVCSEHFVKEDFFIATEHSVRRRLKFTAIPSQKLPSDYNDQLENSIYIRPQLIELKGCVILNRSKRDQSETQSEGEIEIDIKFEDN